MSDLIVMRHPVTGGIGIQTQKQFDDLYVARGWELATVDLDFASSIVGVRIADLSDLDAEQVAAVLKAYNEQKPADAKAALLEHKKEDLVDLADKAGVATTGTKEELADRIIEATAATD